MLHKPWGGGLERSIKKLVLDYSHPVRSYIITDDINYNPNISLGGKWEKLPGGYALVTTEDSGNIDDHNTLADHRKHQAGEIYPDGGLPNIDGTLNLSNATSGNAPGPNSSATRVFELSEPTSSKKKTWGDSQGTYNVHESIIFDASKLNNGYGRYQVLGSTGNVIPSHISVVVWRRLA